MYNDFNEYDMALELAEREYQSLTIQETVAIVQKALDDKWSERAERDSDWVRQQLCCPIAVVMQKALEDKWSERAERDSDWVIQEYVKMMGES